MNNIQPEELQALVQRIINSGVLGRSQTYSDILNYLAECALSGHNPKEMAIAIDVLGRDAEFDVGKDSIVRVHIYHLRNKLKTYFDKYGKQEKYRLDIPKGQYLLTAVLSEDIPQPAEPTLSVTGKTLKRQARTQVLASLAILLLLVNLLIQLGSNNEENAAEDARAYPLAAFSPWDMIFDDEAPILILIGDYYIFGEVNANGDVAKLVREFDVNSAEELDFLQDMGLEGTAQYFDIGLNYIPSSTAYALAQVMEVLLHGVNADRINIKMVSDYTTADLANNHVIYLGLLSGLNNLYSLMFVDSALQIGNTYDELINLETGDYYVSNSGLSGADSYQDFSMLATFPSPNGHQITMIAGMRDESLINISQLIDSEEMLAEIQASPNLSASDANSFEALFEVFGFDKTNFDSSLIYTKGRDPEVVKSLFGGK
tara:strand:- start:143 stop:1432 length:1290 start_codon:yes stop_codon:yes gene_type:complete